MEKTINATIGGVAMFLTPLAMEVLNSVKRILPRMMIANFNRNPFTTV